MIRRLEVSEISSIQVLLEEIWPPTLASWSEQELHDILNAGVSYGLWEQGLSAVLLMQNRSENLFEIFFIGVSQKAQGKGLAQKILREFILLHNPYEIWLEAAARNQKAIHFYTQFGFKKVGVRPAYYQHSGVSEDALLFTWVRSNS